MASESAVLAPPPSSSFLTIVAALPRWPILLIAAIAARLFAFGNPLVHVDEEFYLVTAQRMLEGAIPYVDIWDRKPIGLFLLYLPAAAFGLPAAIWVYQLMALASVVATALILAHLADRAGWGRGALAAALLYLFMINFGDGQGGQAPVFYNLLMAIAVTLILPRPEDRAGDRLRMRRALIALGLIGVALQIKYSVVFEGMFLGLWLLWRERRLGVPTRRILMFGALLVTVALAPTVAAGLVFVAMGHGDAWLFANFTSILARQSDPAAEIRRSLLKIGLMLGPLLLIGGLSRHLPVAHEREREVRGLLFGWMIAATIGLLLFGGYFNHYALPVMLPACLCCAGFLGGHRIGRRIMVPLLACALLGGVYTTYSARYYRGNAPELETLVQAIGRGPGCLYVYSGNSSLYTHSGRCFASPWVFPSHLSRVREKGAVGVDQLAEIERIFASRPEIVVMRPPYEGERAESRALVLRRLGEDYRLRGRYPLGNLMIDVFALQAAPTVATAPRRAATRPS
ncbi:hypothetical protein [Sphingomonas sp. M1-B02]|uniref:hypothetical protein n=1 Tax=Sphingomonas sp. M1-B02 TaxID=3114300 RepID=UPI0022407A37|nr:hypothetical protein [Sphingomonas sp. S6-11]UZK64900.1 hypothetical protein OKW87_10220 [Sphingomonas sp. S6-11]